MAKNKYGGLCAPRHDAAVVVVAVMVLCGDLALHIQPEQPQP